MNPTDTLAAYQSIANITGEMAVAARSGDWDNLTALERQYGALVAQLGVAQPARLTNDMLQKKIALIHKILADDAEIRNYTEPWMKRIQDLIGNAGMERRVRQAYGPGTGGA
jgi:flagellar protein FliT